MEPFRLIGVCPQGGVLAGRLLGNKALLQAYLTPRVIIPAVKPYRSLDYADWTSQLLLDTSQLGKVIFFKSSRTLQQCLQQKRRNASLQQGKQGRNGGFRACYYSHSIVAVLQALMQQWFARGKSVFTTFLQHLWFISVCLTILISLLYQQFSISAVVKFTTGIFISIVSHYT